MTLSKISFIVISFIFLGCQSKLQEREKELELRERELKLKEQEYALEREKNKAQTEPVTTTTDEAIKPTRTLPENGFAYVAFKVKKPELRRFNTESKIVDNPFDDIPPIPDFPERTIVLYQLFVYTSKVFELVDGSEDEKFREIDKEEEKVQLELDRYNAMFRDEMITAPDDLRNAFRNSKAEVLDREIRTFKTYEAASKDRSKNGSIFPAK